MERIRTQLNSGRVDLPIADPEPHCGRDKAVAARVGCFEANRDRMRRDLLRERGLPVGSGVVESACKQIVGSQLKRAGAAGRKRAPTPCSPLNAASNTTAGLTSSIGGLAAPQPHDQKMKNTLSFVRHFTIM